MDEQNIQSSSLNEKVSKIYIYTSNKIENDILNKEYPGNNCIYESKYSKKLKLQKESISRK